MATSQLAEAEKKPKVKGTPQFNNCRSFTPKTPSLAAPMQGLKHNKVASTFNLTLEAISEHGANHLKFDGPLAALAISELRVPTITFPDDPEDSSNLVKTMKWQRKCNHAHDQQKWWDVNTQKIYNLVMQHSTPKMKTKLLTMDSWAKMSATQDGIALLKTICDIFHKKDGGTDTTTILNLAQMNKEMFLVHQLPTKPLSSYLSKFKCAVDVVKSLDGSPWLHPAAAKIVFDKLYGPMIVFALAKASNLADYQVAATEAQRCYLAALFFHGLSNEAHLDLKKKVHNNALMGFNTIPCTYNKVLQLADQYKSSYQQCQPGGGGGIAFAQKGKAAMAATLASSEKIAPHPVAGEKDDKGKMLANSL
jgi:hypothetical protein